MLYNLFGIVFAAVWLSSCELPSGCGNQVIREVHGPSGTLRAVIFQRDCGATTGFSTQISVLPASAKLPNTGGNIFVADTDHGTAPAGPGGGPEVTVEWRDDSHLLVRHHLKARLFTAEKQFQNITIEYGSL